MDSRIDKRDRDRPYFPPFLGFDLSNEDEESGKIKNQDEESRIKKYIEESRSSETVRKTEQWIKRLQAFSNKVNGEEPLECFQKSELNTLICSFLIEVKKINGDEYETTSIHSMFSIINRFLKDHNLGDLDKDEVYQGARDVKKAKLKLLKSEGKGNRPMHATALTKAEEDQLYATGQFGLNSPQALQRTVWWLTTLLFGHRGRNESRQMKWGDIQVKKDESGREYLEFTERCTKTRNGDVDGGSRAFAPKAFETPENPARCPVRTYKEYARRRPKDSLKPDSPFYLCINHKRRAEDPIWYMNAPLGKNTIGKFMKNACQEAGVAGQKTNHSARKTCVKRALEAGCPREYVAQLTGHRSVQSLENYVEADISVQEAMSTSVLTGTKFSVTETCTAPKDRAKTSATTSAQPIIFNITNCGNVTVLNK